MDFNSSLTDGKPPADPFAADGEPNGTSPEALPCAPDAPATEPCTPAPTFDVFLGTSAAIQAALTGEPGTLPPTWCKKCAADVLPAGKGRCPRCNSFLKLNFSARKHPVNKLRRQQLLDKFVLDYRPNTQRLQSMCEQYAGIVEQLEVLKPGSPDHQRLVQLSQLLGAALEESQSSRETRTPSDMQGIDQMPVSALHLAMDLLKRQIAGEQLSERELGQLDVLRAAEHGRVLLPPDPVDVPVFDAPVNTRVESGGVMLLEPGDVGYTEQEAIHATAIDKPAPAPDTCKYCGKSPAGCAESKASRPDVFYALHPIDAQQREDERVNKEFRLVFGMDPWPR